MSKSLVQKTNEAQVLVRALIEMQNQSRKLDVMRGQALWQLKANNLYKKAFGEGVDTWEEFLRSPEIGLTISEANRMMQMYEYFVIKHGIDEEELSDVPIKSLHHMLPRLKSGEIREEDVPELIDAARELTFNQFKERVYDVLHEDSALRTYSYVLMRRCNETKNLSRVQEVTSDMIITAFPHLHEA